MDPRTVDAGQGLFWTTDPNEALPIRTDVGEAAEMSTMTVIDMLRENVINRPEKVSHRYYEEGQMREVTWKEHFYKHVFPVAKSLASIRAPARTGVTIQGRNDYKWSVINTGSILANCLPLGSYLTNASDTAVYLADLPKSEVVFVEDDEQLQKYFSEDGESLPKHAKCYVVWKKVSGEWQEKADKPVYSWSEFIALGVNTKLEVLNRRNQGISPGHCCSIISTSGTTGSRPKGAMLSHDNITFMARNVARLFKLQSDFEGIAYLRIAHIAAQILDLYGPMAIGSTVTFAPTALDRKTLVEDLKRNPPSYFFSAPRGWEKIQEGMIKKGSEAKAFVRKLGAAAKRKNLETAHRRDRGMKPKGFYRAPQKLMDRVKYELGLHNSRFLAAGADVIQPETIEYFRSVNIPLLNVYGMTEAAGVITCNTPEHNKFGTVGKRLPGTQVKLLDPDENGKREIVCFGRHVFMGYIGDPEKTKEMFTPDGYLRTGDYGEFDQEEYLTVTGRKKDLMIVGGHNIAHLPIEASLRAELPCVSNAMLVGGHYKITKEGQPLEKNYKFVTAVLTLKTVTDENDNPTQDLDPDVITLFQSWGSDAKTVEEARRDETILGMIEEGILRVNGKQEGPAKIKKSIILPDDFSIMNGSITPTFKLRRAVVVLDIFRKQIDAMYAAK